MSNGLDADQDRHFVGPDLGPNCLQWLSAVKNVEELSCPNIKVNMIWHIVKTELIP